MANRFTPSIDTLSSLTEILTFETRIKNTRHSTRSHQFISRYALHNNHGCSSHFHCSFYSRKSNPVAGETSNAVVIESSSCPQSTKLVRSSRANKVFRRITSNEESERAKNDITAASSANKKLTARHWGKSGDVWYTVV